MSPMQSVRLIENECMMRYYERNVPGLLKYIKENYFHRSIWYTPEGQGRHHLDEPI